jgi:WD40 repeat protein
MQKKSEEIEIPFKIKNKRDITLSEIKEINAMAIFPSGNIIYSNHDSLIILDSNYDILQIIGIDELIFTICIINQKLFYTGGSKGIIKKWEEIINHERKIKVFEENKNEKKEPQHNDSITQILVNEKLMYSCSYDQTVKIRDKDNIQKTTESLNINLGKIYSMFFDIDFKVLIISGEKGTEFWNQNNDNYNKIDFEEGSKCEISSYQYGIKTFEKNENNMKIVIGGLNLIELFFIKKEQKLIITRIQTIKIDYFCVCISIHILNNKIIFFTGESITEINEILKEDEENYKIRVYIKNNDQFEYCDKYENAHKKCINGLIKLNEALFISFSDDGRIKIWKFKKKLMLNKN